MREGAAVFCALLGIALSPGSVSELLNRLVSESYLKLARLPEQEIPPSAFDGFRQWLQSQRKLEEQKLDGKEKALHAEDEQARLELERLNREASRDTPEMAAERQRLHCRVLQVQHQLRANKAERKFGVAAEYDNRLAKLDLLERWPAKRRAIRREIEAGRARRRPHGDVEDIRIRVVGDGQEKDVRLGQQGRRELQGRELLPMPVSDAKVNQYVQGLAECIAANSDLRVPVRVSVLATREINSFSLPGGFVFVNAGLIEHAGRESELAGVLAHEIAHVAARHGYRLTSGLSIRNVVSEGVQMAANVFSGGATGTAAHYMRAYGIFGFGMALNLRLLGVDPDFEAEADRLGVQYLWRAGYDPTGFIAFFDKMASEPSALLSASFFHVHPPYAEAIQTTFSELEYLPAKSGLRSDSPAFHGVKKELEKIMRNGGFDMNAPDRSGPIPECQSVPPAKRISE